MKVYIIHDGGDNYTVVKSKKEIDEFVKTDGIRVLLDDPWEQPHGNMTFLGVEVYDEDDEIGSRYDLVACFKDQYDSTFSADYSIRVVNMID